MAHKDQIAQNHSNPLDFLQQHPHPLCEYSGSCMQEHIHIHPCPESPAIMPAPIHRSERECVCLIMNDTFGGLDLTRAYYISISIYSLCLTPSAKALSKSKSFITDGGDLNRRGDLEVSTSSEGDSASLGIHDNEERGGCWCLKSMDAGKPPSSLCLITASNKQRGTGLSFTSSPSSVTF